MRIVVEEPAANMGNLNLQQCRPEGKLLSRVSGPMLDLPEMASLHGLFMKIVRDSKHSIRKKTALIFENQTMSFGQLDRLSDALMAVLADMFDHCPINDLQQESFRIAVCMEPSLDLVITVFAILKLKAAVVPFDAAWTLDRMRTVVSEVKPAILICDCPDLLRQSISQVVVLGIANLLEIARTPCRNHACPVFHDSDQNLPAAILYTSGSSGQPKAVALSHRLIMNRVMWQWNDLPYVMEEMGILKTEISFIVGFLEIFVTLLAGRTLLLARKVSKENPAEFFAVLQRYPVRKIIVVPSFLKILCEYMESEGKQFYGPLELVASTGEILPHNLAVRFYECFPQAKLANFYSLTDCAGEVFGMVFEGREHFAHLSREFVVPVGKVINNYSAVVVDEKGRPVPRNTWGELFVSGYYLSNNHLFPNNSFHLDNDHRLWYHTGDLAYISDSEIIYVKGRVQDQIVVGGKRFHLSEVEELLSQIPTIRDSAVVKMNDGNCTKIYAFYYSGDQGGNDIDFSTNKAKTTVRNKLPSFVHPSFVRCDEPFPLLANGKVDRRRLYSMFEDKLVGWENVEVPTPLGTIATVLEISPNSIELDKSFAENGGTSLNTVQTILQLSKAGFKISIQDFLLAATVREIVSNCEWTPPHSPPKQNLTPTGSSSPGKIHDSSVVSFSSVDKDKIADMLTAYFLGEPNEFSENYPRLTSAELQKIATKFVNEVAEDMWSSSAFCYVVTLEGSLQAVAVAFDIHGDFAQAQTLFSGPPGPVAQMTELTLAPLLAGIPKLPGVVVRNFLMVTDPTLPAQQAISLYNLMEEELENRARVSGFQYVCAVNSNKTRQQLAELRGTERWAVYQANRLSLPDGTVPLAEAPDSLKITVDVCIVSANEAETSL